MRGPSSALPSALAGDVALGTDHATPGGEDRRADIAAVADRLIDLIREFNRARANLLPAAQGDVEWPAQILLRSLSIEGPMRGSWLATYLQADPSTVSRHVASLVKQGLVERRADPEGGRLACSSPRRLGR